MRAECPVPRSPASVSRGREGTFEPRCIPKHERRFMGRRPDPGARCPRRLHRGECGRGARRAGGIEHGSWSVRYRRSWPRGAPTWTTAMNQIAILYGDRFTAPTAENGVRDERMDAAVPMDLWTPRTRPRDLEPQRTQFPTAPIRIIVIVEGRSKTASHTETLILPRAAGRSSRRRFSAKVELGRVGL